MDNIQQLLKEMKGKVPDCTASRQRLKSILSDYIPTEKQKINSILNAYDEDVENRISGSSDKTLTALQFIKILKDDYGMTEDNAFWSIETWCYLLGYEEIAEAIENTIGNSTHAPKKQQANPSNSGNKCAELGMGIYKAGVDIPLGELKLKIETKRKNPVWYGLTKNPNNTDAHQSFIDQTYITIKDGQYLYFENPGGETLKIAVYTV